MAMTNEQMGMTNWLNSQFVMPILNYSRIRTFLPLLNFLQSFMSFWACLGALTKKNDIKKNPTNFNRAFGAQALIMSE